MDDCREMVWSVSLQKQRVAMAADNFTLHVIMRDDHLKSCYLEILLDHNFIIYFLKIKNSGKICTYFVKSIFYDVR